MPVTGPLAAHFAEAVLDTDSPVTIGLGDTFIGGLIAVLADELDTVEVP